MIEWMNWYILLWLVSSSEHFELVEICLENLGHWGSQTESYCGTFKWSLCIQAEPASFCDCDCVMSGCFQKILEFSPQLGVTSSASNGRVPFSRAPKSKRSASRIKIWLEWVMWAGRRHINLNPIQSNHFISVNSRFDQTDAVGAAKMQHFCNLRIALKRSKALQEIDHGQQAPRTSKLANEWMAGWLAGWMDS